MRLTGLFEALEKDEPTDIYACAHILNEPLPYRKSSDTTNLDDTDEFESGIGRPVTDEEAIEISKLLGGNGEVGQIDTGCYNISVGVSHWYDLETNGSLDLRVQLSSGLIAALSAEMP